MDKKELLQYVDDISDTLNDISLKVWSNPEISGEEEFAAQAYREILKENDFKIVEVDGMDHAFYGEYGSGKPVIAILGEYDALPDLSQKVCTEYDQANDGGPGHGCGHNLLGAGALGGALALKKYLEETGKEGTIRFFMAVQKKKL